MKLVTAVMVVGSLMMAGSEPAAGQSGHDLFQQAVVRERLDGDLQGAIRLYERVVREHAGDRRLAARALVQIGRSYEKLGSPKARFAYLSVVEEYPDQREPLRVARQRLSEISRDAASARTGAAPARIAEADPSFTLLREDMFASAKTDRAPAPYDVSPDGKQIVFRVEEMERPSGLYISDRTGAVMRPLIIVGDVPISAFAAPHWSPDGQHIAFRAVRMGQNLGAAIFVIDPDGSGLRQVGDPIGRVLDLTWTADSGALTYVERSGGPGGAGNQVHTRTLDGRTVQLTRGEPLPGRIILGGYSSGGSWLAFHASDSSGPPVGPEVWILPAEGGRALQVTHSEGFDGHPSWGPDGRLYFVSDRNGGLNIWRVVIDTETGALLGEPQQVTFYNDAEALYPKVVQHGSGLAFLLNRVTTTVRVADAVRPKESHAVVRGFAPQLSPDGSLVYYQGEGPGQDGIFVVPRAGGTPLRLTQGRPRGGFQTRFDLSSDGAAIVYVGPTERGRAIFVVPTTGGTPRHIVDIADESESVVPVWSPDGSQLAFASENGMYVVPREGGEPNKIAHMWRWSSFELQWSPDGRYLAAFGWEGPDVEKQIFVVPVSGGEVRRLTPLEENAYKEGLQWHPDSQRLTYIHYDYRDGKDGDGIRLAYLDGRPTTLLIDEPDTWDYVGVWAPDGTGFYYVTAPDDAPGWKMKRWDSATGAITEHLDANVSARSLPLWSQDGSTMMWCLEKTVNQLWIMEDFQ